MEDEFFLTRLGIEFSFVIENLDREQSQGNYVYLQCKALRKQTNQECNAEKPPGFGCGRFLKVWCLKRSRAGELGTIKLCEVLYK